jgi:hypothetical protein
VDDVEIIDLKKINNGKVREEYQVITSERCAGLEKSDSRVDTNRA